MRALDLLWTVRDAAGLSAHEKLCMLMLLAFTDGKPTSKSGAPKDPLSVVIAQPPLARATGLSVRMVRKVLAELEVKGAIVVTPGGQHHPNRYALRPAGLAALVSPREAPGAGLNGSSEAPHAALEDVRPAPRAALEASPPKLRPANGVIQTGTARHPDRHRVPPSEDLSEDLSEDHFSLVPSSTTKPAKKSATKRATREPSGDHAKVIAHWYVAHEAAKGVKPVKPKGADVKAAKEMLAAMPFAEVLEIITRAYADPWLVDNRPTLAFVWSSVEKYRGVVTHRGAPSASRNTGRVLQPDAGDRAWTPATPITSEDP